MCMYEVLEFDNDQVLTAPMWTKDVNRKGVEHRQTERFETKWMILYEDLSLLCGKNVTKFMWHNEAQNEVIKNALDNSQYWIKRENEVLEMRCLASFRYVI